MVERIFGIILASICVLVFTWEAGRQWQIRKQEYAETPPRTYQTITDEVEVCFDLTSSEEIKGWVYPSGCFSSSCTMTEAKGVVVAIDRSESEIRFNSIFELSSPGVDFEKKIAPLCTQDCGGVRAQSFNLGKFSEGIHNVILGEKLIGELAVPLWENELSGMMPNQYCLSEKD